MSVKNPTNNRLKSAIFGVFFAVLSIFGFTTISAFVNPSPNAYAEPAETTSVSNPQNTSNNSSGSSGQNSANGTNSSNNQSSSNSTNGSDNTNNSSNTSTSNTSNNEQTEEEKKKAEEEKAKENQENCEDQLGALGWFICPGVGVLSKAIDSIYSQIESLLAVSPVTIEDGSAIFYIWQIMRDITNILFVIVLLIVIYSQITGLGITNYGIKKALPKLIIAAVLVNLSYLICALAVDASNILGSGLRGLFDSIQLQVINNGGLPAGASTVTWEDLSAAVIGGGMIAGFAIAAGSLLFPIIGAILCAILSVLVGLITLGLRQSLVSVLIMISPIAFVCYLLPNTDKWFSKWKDIFISMLIFYPMFSLLFGASRLAGWALIATSIEHDNAFGIVIGMLIQVLPLILSISLMKMSSTVLGKASGLLDNLANYPKNGIRSTAEKYRALSRHRHVNNSAMPSAHLQRFLDKRNRKLELDTENEATIRKGRAEVWAQREILGNHNYDPIHDKEYKNGGKDKHGNQTKHKLRTSRSTRAAKEAMNYTMAADNATRDTAHVLGNYGDYHGRTYRDNVIGKTAAKNFLEYTRTMHVEENDAYADQDWVMGKYEEMRKSGKDSEAYKHYIVGGAGSLGEAGQNTVLGEVISKSALNESKRRSYTALLLAKYGYGGANKQAFRDFYVGYSINDDGLAVDKVTRSTTLNYKNPKTGEVIQVKERSPGEFLKYHPEYLNQCSGYTKKDENGYYFDLTDQSGKFVSRIYKNDSAAVKEILSNSDMPIADAVDGLYGLLSGTDPGSFAKDGYENLGGVGLSNFSTTIDRALRSSGFKEKAAFASPLYGTMVNQRYIKDFVHQNLARLDSLNKTAKAGSLNIQDSAEWHQLELLLNEANWDWMLFDEDSLRTFQNINGQYLTGTRYKTDDAGNYIKNADGSFAFDEIAADSNDLTFDDLKNTVVRKFLAPAGQRLPTLMARITPNIIENQKPGVAEPWQGVVEDFKNWSDPDIQAKYPSLKDPMAKRDNDTLAKAQELGYQIGVRQPKRGKSQGGGSSTSQGGYPSQVGNAQNSTQSQPVSFTPGQTVSLNNAGSSEIVEASPELKTRKRESAQRAAGQKTTSEQNVPTNEQSTQSSDYEDMLARGAANNYSVDSDYLDEDEDEDGYNQDYNDIYNNNLLDNLENADQRRFPDYEFEISRLASTYTTVDSFISAATSYFSEAAANDPRLSGVVDEFQNYVTRNSNNNSIGVNSYASALERIVSKVTYNN